MSFLQVLLLLAFSMIVVQVGVLIALLLLLRKLQVRESYSSEFHLSGDLESSSGTSLGKIRSRGTMSISPTLLKGNW
jgi:hypothetical protein